MPPWLSASASAPLNQTRECVAAGDGLQGPADDRLHGTAGDGLQRTAPAAARSIGAASEQQRRLRATSNCSPNQTV